MSNIDEQRKAYAFTKDSRLLHSAQFRPIFDSAQLIASSPSFLLLAIYSDQPRIGLVVAKKHFKLAVTRNRIKRVVRESFRHYQFDKPCDIVVLARPGLDATTTTRIHKDINRLWGRLKPAKPKRGKR